MPEAIVMQLPAILTALALLITSLTTLLQVWKGRAKLNEIAMKVDGGMTTLQTALADIAKQAQAHAAAAGGKTVVVKDGQRSTDK